MYDFHYNFFKKNFYAELLFTDTDSPTYEIKLKNVYKELNVFSKPFSYVTFYEIALKLR